jgi:hypothetical protein
VGSRPILSLGWIGVAVAAGAFAAPIRFSVLDDPPSKSDVTKAQYRVSQQKKDRSTIVAIYAGEKPTGGWSVVVQTVDRDAKTGVCTIDYKVSPPNPDAFVTQALAYPSVAIRIDSPGCKKVQVRPPLPQR